MQKKTHQGSSSFPPQKHNIFKIRKLENDMIHFIVRNGRASCGTHELVLVWPPPGTKRASVGFQRHLAARPLASLQQSPHPACGITQMKPHRTAREDGIQSTVGHGPQGWAGRPRGRGEILTGGGVDRRGAAFRSGL